MLRLILTGLAVLGTFLGSRMYLPSMSHTAFVAPVINMGVSYVLLACFIVAALSLGWIAVGKHR
jgi:hypothetical protein